MHRDHAARMLCPPADALGSMNNAGKGLHELRGVELSLAAAQAIAARWGATSAARVAVPFALPTIPSPSPGR